jgi:mRNA interferase MazF
MERIAATVILQNALHNNYLRGFFAFPGSDSFHEGICRGTNLFGPASPELFCSVVVALDSWFRRGNSFHWPSTRGTNGTNFHYGCIGTNRGREMQCGLWKNGNRTVYCSWIVRLASLDPIRGREQAGTRPCLVVSVDPFNHGPADLVVVLPITSKSKKHPMLVEVIPPEGGLRERSYVKCYDIRSIAQERLIDHWGRVSEETMRQVEGCLRDLLDLCASQRFQREYHEPLLAPLACPHALALIGWC